ncbi:MAG: YjjG family noncanonical pyrimidine nucleotidase [Peptoniphilaceae bacterium]|nr:YjjG family noncanonical pyrimidine nucleotidase [Peptoniphilaceae bacterium]MDY6018809.1 YjjG family noncanonical pyrimidine nucleotidase [Anaerococcus sp.]
MIKYILWDIDATLLDFDLAEDNSIRYCFDYFDLGFCSADKLLAYKKINDKYWKALERREIDKKQVLIGRFVEFFNKYGYDASIAEDFNEKYQKSLAKFSEFNPFAEEIVAYFHGKYRQFGATNGTKIAQVGKLKKSGLDKSLEKVFISEELGVEKPAKEFFDYIFSYIGDYNKNSYVIIGDSLTSDIQGGVNAAIKTIWFNPKNHQNTLNLRTDYVIKSLKDLKEIL